MNPVYTATIQALLRRDEGKREHALVIGSGIGAASTCYFLNKLFQGNIVIDIYESANHLGGRTESINVNGTSMELGAGIAYSGNKYVSGWVDEFKLHRRKPANNIFGLWDGTKFVFQKCDSSTLTAAKMIARYGNDLNVLRSSVYDLLGKFNTIYPLQEAGKCFDTPADLWESVGLLEATQLHFDGIMAEKLSPNSLLQRELMFAVNRVNYNQNTTMNYLAGMVSMCPVVTGDVFSLSTGWTSIHQAIFKCSGVRNLHLSHPVSGVRSEDSPTSSAAVTSMGRKYSVEVAGRSVGSYDAVVVTAPLNSVHPVQFLLDGQLVDTSRYERKFRVTHTTLVKGRMNRSHFHPSTPAASTYPPSSWLDSLLQMSFGKLYNDPTVLPTTVYLTEEGAAQEKFSSYARYFDYDSEGAAIGSEQFKGHSLFKVFSAEPLDVSTLAELFSADSCVVTTRKWFAYPIFSPPEDVSVPFRVKQNHSVFNSSVLEFSVAAMEVSAISGRNVALLVYRDFCKDIDYEKSS